MTIAILAVTAMLALTGDARGLEPAKNYPVAACAHTSQLQIKYPKLNQEYVPWGLDTNYAPSYTRVEFYFKKGPFGYMQIGRLHKGTGLYPVPWCHLEYDETCSCAFYWCGEHLFDEFIPKPEPWGSRQLMGNRGPDSYDATWSEYRARQFIGGGKIVRGVGYWIDYGGGIYGWDPSAWARSQAREFNPIQQPVPNAPQARRSVCATCATCGAGAGFSGSTGSASNWSWAAFGANVLEAR
ncbi:MAG: hypothetical protein HY816_11430 [Candidatus Wallbacteria bacterium]|nr:hypothetical protein [Candidatus Wallbacteria bacterium]